MHRNQTKIIPTSNPDWGFWGTALRSGYDVDLCWSTVMIFLIQEFNLKPTHARDILDSRFGRYLADEFEDIASHNSAIAITEYLQERTKDKRWMHNLEDIIEGTAGVRKSLIPKPILSWCYECDYVFKYCICTIMTIIFNPNNNIHKTRKYRR